MAQDLENGHKINVQFRFGRRRIRLGIVEICVLDHNAAISQKWCKKLLP